MKLNFNMNMNIRQRMLIIIMSITSIVLIISTIISFFAMYDGKKQVRRVGDEIIQKSTESSSKILSEQKISELLHIAEDKSEDVNSSLLYLMRDVDLIADAMTNIYTHPDKFFPRILEDYNKISVQYDSSIKDQSFTTDMGMMANLQNMLYNFNETNPMVDLMVLSSKDGVTIGTRNKNSNRSRSNEDESKIYNVLSVDWYKKAVSERKIIFSDVRNFVFSGKPGFFCAEPYFNGNNEIMGVAAAQISLERINKMVQEVELYNTGFCFIMDNHGRVILSSDDDVYSEDNPSEVGISLKRDVRDLENKELAEAAEKMMAGEKGIVKVKIDGATHYLAFAPVEITGWSFATAIEEKEVNEPIKENNEIIEEVTNSNIEELSDRLKFTIIFTIILMILVYIATVYANRKLSDYFVRPIYQLSDDVREIASGNFDKKIEIHTGDEIEHLAAVFNAMTDELKRYMENLTKITAEKERSAAELNVAKNIQLSMLPNNFDFKRKDFEIFASMEAAKSVGGDFYDFYLIDKTHLVITIADVSGKGVPAALFMATSKTILKNFVLTMRNPDDFAAVMTCSNQQLCQNNKAMMFVTVFMGMLDLRTGEFFFVNGGHNPPLIYQNNQFNYLKLNKACVLGIKKNFSFTQQKTVLNDGDIIFLYTDGVTEAMNLNHEQYNEKRLQDFLNQSSKNIPLEELLKEVKKDVKKHAGEAEQSDDITMLALRFNKI